MINDSAYNRNMPRGTVIGQSPGANSQVKENRKIYLIMNALVPEQVALPELEDIGLKHAISILESIGLKVDLVIPEPSESQTVIRAEKDGKEIDPNTMVEKYSSIDLVVGQVGNAELLPVPDLIGKTLMYRVFPMACIWS